MLKFVKSLFLLFLVAVFCASAFAQSAGAPTAPEPGITRDQADQILQELRQIRQLLARPPAAPAPAQQAPQQPQTAKLSIAGLTILGRRDAPLTMVEFSDYQCPFCRSFHSGTFDEIKRNWIDTGKLRFVSWDLPLEFHSNAAKAAQAARCAGDQNKFWELRNLLIANATKLEPASVLDYAQQVPQLDFERFKACVQSDRFSADIKKSGADANALGISGTPTFLIAHTSGDLVDGQILVGAQTYAVFDKFLKDQLPK